VALAWLNRLNEDEPQRRCCVELIDDGADRSHHGAPRQRKAIEPIADRVPDVMKPGITDGPALFGVVKLAAVGCDQRVASTLRSIWEQELLLLALPTNWLHMLDEMVRQQSL